MIGVCSKCGKAFETTTEDAYTPGVLCVACHRAQHNPPGLSPIYAAARQMLDALDKGATSATATVRDSTQIATMTDGGDYRVLTVDDESPLHPDTLATWAAAFGVQAAAWRSDESTGGKVARLEWPTDGEAVEGGRVTWINRAK